MKSVVLVSNEFGDWEGLYIDDELIAESHSLKISDVGSKLVNFGIQFNEIELTEDDLDSLRYELPNSLMTIQKVID